jgi:Rieske Fe-S protein
LWKRGRSCSPADLVDAGPLTDVPIDQWRQLTVQVTRIDGWEKRRVPYSFWVRREALGDPGITVLSSLCPHLGCPIGWHAEQARFICPCHAATFDALARSLVGPPHVPWTR